MPPPKVGDSWSFNVPDQVVPRRVPLWIDLGVVPAASYQATVSGSCQWQDPNDAPKMRPLNIAFDLDGYDATTGARLDWDSGLYVRIEGQYVTTPQEIHSPQFSRTVVASVPNNCRLKLMLLDQSESDPAIALPPVTIVGATIVVTVVSQP